MNKLLLSFFLFFSITSYSQYNIGFLDNYSGITSLFSNPANIADNYLNTDTNILSVSLNIGNNVIPFSPYKLFRKNEFDYSNGNGTLNEYFDTFDFTEKSNGYINLNIQGPSYFKQINRLSSFAIFTNIRNNFYIYNLDSTFYKKLLTGFYLDNPISTDINLSNILGKGNLVSWTELGFSYAKVLYHKKNKLLKVGGSFKFLFGLQSFTFNAKNINVSINDNLLDQILNEEELIDDVLQANINLDYEFSKVGFNYGNSIDFGFVYEKRINTLPKFSIDDFGLYYIPSPYNYKISASITDLGFLNFKNINSNNFEAFYNFPDDFNQNTIENQTSKTFATPLTSHFNFDYRIYKNFLVNGNFDFYMLPRKSNYTINNISSLTVSPRYESYNFSFFMPIAINEYGIFKSGIGFRTPYFFLNSSTFISNFTKKSKAFEVSFGVKIPIKNKRKFIEFKRSLKHHQVSSDAL